MFTAVSIRRVCRRPRGQKRATNRPLTASLSEIGFAATPLDDHTVEVVVDRTQSLNQLFAALDARNIVVSSLRNKTNRLEELFVSLVQEAGGRQ